MAYQKIELLNNTGSPIMLTESGFWFSLPAAVKVNIGEMNFTIKDVENSVQLNGPTGLLRIPVGSEQVSLYLDDVAVLPANLNTTFAGNEYYTKNEFVSAFTGLSGQPIKTDATGHIDGAFLSGALIDHTTLANLNTVNYYHLTQANHTTLTTGVDADSLHKHTHENLNNVDSGTYRHLSSSQVTTLTTGVDADSLHKHTYGNLTGIPGAFNPTSHALAVSGGYHSGTLPWTDINFTGSTLTSIATRNHSDLQNINGSTYHVSSAQYDALVGNVNLSTTNYVIGWQDLNARIRVAVDTIANLKAITAERYDKQIVNLRENEALYEWQSASTRVADDNIVIIPNDIVHPAPGRWIRCPNPEQITHNWLANIQGDVVNQYYHLSQAQHSALTSGTSGDALHTHTFINLTDTPAAFAGYGGRSVQVNSGATGLEFSAGIGVDQLYTATLDPTGFPNRTDSVISFSNALDPNPTLSIYPAVTSFDYYIKGVKYTKSTAQNVDITDTEGLWYFYFDGATLTASQSLPADAFYNKALVAMVYWDSTNNVAITLTDERHGISMDWTTHNYLHRTVGTRFGSGLQVTAVRVSALPQTNDNVDNGKVVMTAGDLWDEDINAHITHSATPTNPYEQILSPIAKIPIYYLEGTGSWRKIAASDYLYATSGGFIQYNLYSAPNWALAPLTNTNYVAMWVVATTSITEPVIAIMGQRQDTSLANAQANNTFGSLSLASLPVVEMKLLYRVIIRGSTGYTPMGRIQEILDFRTASSLPVSQFVATDHNSLTGRDGLNSHPATAIQPDTTNFDKILSSADDTVQKALDTLDNHHDQASTSSNGVSTTSAITMQTKVTLNFTPAHTALYILHWSAEVSSNNAAANRGAYTDVFDGTNLIAGEIYNNFGVANTYASVSGICLLSLTASTPYSYSIRWRALNGGDTVGIRNARMFIRKVN